MTPRPRAVSESVIGERRPVLSGLASSVVVGFTDLVGKARLVRGRPVIWVLGAALVALALVLDVVVIAPLAPIELGAPLPWWSLAIFFAVAEIFIIEFTSRQDTHSFTLSELPLVVGLFVLAPRDLILAQAVGATAALLLQGPRQPIKILFNIGNFMVGTAIAVLVFRQLVALGDPLGPAGWFAGFSAAFVSDTLATLLVLTAISLSEGRPPTIPRLIGLGTLYTLADTSLALVSVVVLLLHPVAGWLLIVLACVFFFGYRAYGSMRQRHESLETLQRSTRSIELALSVDRVAETLAQRARDMFHADRVDVLFLGGTDGPRRVMHLDHDGDAGWVTLPKAPDGQHGPDRPPVTLPTAPARLTPEAIAEITGREPDGMATIAAPLKADGESLGVLVVGIDGGDWRAEQLTLLDTFANHASVAIQNARLVERLRHQAEDHEFQATHDALTGLPNRVLFRRALSQAVAHAAMDGGGFAVLIMDLDRFKEVNDTLGHHSGDVLLRQIAHRLTRVLDSSVFIARLSGDEFAVLAPGVDDYPASVILAGQLLAAFDEPVEIQEVHVDVEGSVGIALFPEHGGDGDTLLQRADVAMYQAKASHNGFEIYRPDRDLNTPARLALMGELRTALDQGQLAVVYQPQLDVALGRIGGAEALVRWVHPRHGEIAAGEFVPLAEQTGLIRPLMLFVLRDALDRCRAWRGEGFALTVSVNLSVRNLLDGTLADEIAEALAERDLPPAALIVEITETSLMSDPVRSEAMLHRLRNIGVGVSIDDFGTGHASLAYLKRFPVSELKIDRAFVREIDTDEGDLRIVESTILLAHALGLRVVAEGSETAGVTRRLQELACDVIQGYDFGRPITPDAFRRRLLEERWLAGRTATERRGPGPGGRRASDALPPMLGVPTTASITVPSFRRP